MKGRGLLSPMKIYADVFNKRLQSSSNWAMRRKGLIYGAMHKSGDLLGSFNKVRVIKCLRIRNWTLEMKNDRRVNRVCQCVFLEQLMDKIKSTFLSLPIKHIGSQMLNSTSVQGEK